MNAAAFLAMFASVFGLFLQICVAIDLILSIRRPFSPKEPRIRAYICVSFIAAVFQGVTLTFGHQYGTVNLTVKFGGVFAMISITCCWVISAISIVYGLVKLCKPNISQKVRQQVIIRHVVTIVFFVISQAYIQIGFFIIFSPTYWDKPYPDLTSEHWASALKIIFAAQGIFLPLTRIAEPYFYQTVAKRTKAFIQDINCCCCGLAEARRQRLLQEEFINDLSFVDRGMNSILMTDSTSGFAELRTSLNSNGRTDSTAI